MKEKDISKNFTQEALEVIQKACDLAHQMKRSSCNSGHLFRILIEQSYVQQIYGKMNIPYEKILKELDTTLKHSQYPVNIKPGRVIFSPDLKATILRSYLIEKNVPNGTVGIEDLSLACLFSPQINEIVKKIGVNLSHVESFITSYKQGPQEGSSTLMRFTTDLTKKAEENKLHEITDREKELSQIIRILVRSSKNNVILLGEMGVGRSSIVHLLAQKIVEGNVPAQLKNTKILEFNFSGFISALTSRNVTDLLETFTEELSTLGNVIIFIKNFEVAYDETSAEKNLILNMIKNLLTVSKARLVLSTTSGSYKHLLTKEAAFSTNFEAVKVAEPSIELAQKILEKVGKRLSEFHNVEIDKDAILASINLSKRYIQDKFLPSKAIDILDEASSKATLENRNKITVDDIRAIISEKTGIPIEKLTTSEQKKLTNLEEILNKNIIGQKEAVHIVSDVVRRSRAGLKDPKKPIGSFLFLGPSGVGKTFLAKNLTRIIYDSESAMIRIDMSEFSESHTVQRLIGSPPGYIGYEEGGQLTNPVWERPYSLILLDEIEKAHAKVFDIFLQVLDEGRLTDGQGRTVDFKNTIIIATSNIASEEILEKLKLKKEGAFERELFLEEEVLPLLKEYFRPEFINRFDEIVIFNPLGIEELKIIAKLQIEKNQKRLQEKEIQLNVSEAKLEELAQKSYKPAFGARPLIRIIQEEIENVLAKKIISGSIKRGDTVNL